MRELMRSDWYRARRCHLGALLWVEAAIVLLLVIMALDRGYTMDGIERLGLGPSVPGAYVLIAAMVSAITFGISSELDYADGAIRNKLVTGHSRAQAYWASYLTNTLVAYLVAAVYLVLILGTGLHWTDYDFSGMMAYLAQGIGAIAAFTALYSLIGVIWTRRGAAVVCIVTALVLLIVSNQISNALAEPEFYEPDVVRIMQIEGDIAPGTDIVQNMQYVREPARSVYEFLSSFLPSGQAVQMIDGPGQFLPLYALGFCAVCWTAALTIVKFRNIR